MRKYLGYYIEERGVARYWAVYSAPDRRILLTLQPSEERVLKWCHVDILARDYERQQHQRRAMPREVDG